MNLVTCNQIHSSNIHIVIKNDVGTEIPNCDGLITNIPNVNISIKTADCVPMTIKDPIKKVVGVVHAGWRGTEKEITKKAINLMVSTFASETKDIKVQIGPAIDKDNYLIKKDVASRFMEKYSDFLELVSDNQWKLDLVGVNIKQLLSAGVLETNIENSKISTFKNKNYPSFRRDRKSVGFETSIMIK